MINRRKKDNTDRYIGPFDEKNIIKYGQGSEEVVKPGVPQ